MVEWIDSVSGIVCLRDETCFTHLIEQVDKHRFAVDPVEKPERLHFVDV